MKMADALSIARRVAIQSTLETTGGNVSAAARLLGINRGHLHLLIVKYGLSRTLKPYNAPTSREIANWRRA